MTNKSIPKLVIHTIGDSSFAVIDTRDGNHIIKDGFKTWEQARGPSACPAALKFMFGVGITSLLSPGHALAFTRPTINPVRQYIADQTRQRPTIRLRSSLKPRTRGRINPDRQLICESVLHGETVPMTRAELQRTASPRAAQTKKKAARDGGSQSLREGSMKGEDDGLDSLNRFLTAPARDPRAEDSRAG
jgi:hypothetical protein